MKRCTRCRKEKPDDVAHFSRHAKGALSAACKVCLARLERIRYYRRQIDAHSAAVRCFNRRVLRQRAALMNQPVLWEAEITRLLREDRR